MPTVSVVVPTYNRADALPRTIDSVLDQTLEDFELLVVDDASEDHTESVVTGYDDPRVTYLAHETNQGGSAARNTGIEHAEGEYVAFLDSDDEWLPRKLERQVWTLRTRSDEWVAAYCGVELAGDRHPLYEGLASVISRKKHTEGDEGGSELIGDVLADELHTSAGSTLLVRTEVARAIDGFDESFDRFQDPEFLIRVLRRGKLAYVDDQLVRRYATGSPPPEAVAAADAHYLNTFSETVDRLEAQGRDITGAHNYMLARLYLSEGDFRQGARHLVAAKRPEPRQFPGLVYVVGTGVRRKVRS